MTESLFSNPEVDYYAFFSSTVVKIKLNDIQTLQADAGISESCNKGIVENDARPNLMTR